MTHPLLDCASIDQPPDQFLRGVGVVFAEFGNQTQDSGNRSYGVQIAGQRYFVKTAGWPDDSQPALPHAARVALLRNAARLHTSFQHPILPPLKSVIESPDGPLLVYAWAEGELLGVPRARRDDPSSSFQRFRSLPAPTICRCLDAIFDLHAALARAGWVAVDFYDGCLIYDFAADRIAVVDLDMYHFGPFQNERGRMFGSTRFMAPEEFELGARIDERTTVFTMGRTALLYLSDGALIAERFRGTPALFEVVARACEPDPARRFDSPAAYYDAWRAASLVYF
jgi:serine/threonine-protein kinase